jgi:hypothetical protein
VQINHADENLLDLEETADPDTSRRSRIESRISNVGYESTQDKIREEKKKQVQMAMHKLMTHMQRKVDDRKIEKAISSIQGRQSHIVVDVRDI